jgi:glycosyltransferase involved in cell wall biosynthesis
MLPGKIFVQIASYRDNQLLPTLRDCNAKADHPENLVFCIAWQHAEEDSWDNLDEYKYDKRFKVIDINYKDTKGACWARNKIQQLYDDEEYTLQLDSHHRFVPHWDTLIIEMYQQLKEKGYPKPLLTSYLPSFNPENDPEERTLKPYKLTFDRFTPDGVIFFMPATIDDFETLTEPITCRFYSAHFCFTSGDFCREVQHDPNYYFHGEEISIAVRAYTWGYDLFSPHKLIAWHEYTRRYRKKHWDDHTTWKTTDNEAYIRMRALLGIDGTPSDLDQGIYGLGPVRTLDQYERYAGINFKTRALQQYTLDHTYPPNPEYTDLEEYEKSYIKVFKHCIDIYEAYLPESDYTFIAVIFEDSEGKSIHRQDITAEELPTLKDTFDKFYKIWRTFVYTGEKPYKYIVWPYSEAKGWCDRIEDVIHKPIHHTI